MRNFMLLLGSIVALGSALSACGTKGPLTLPPKPQAAQSGATEAAPATDANTEAGQH